MRLSVAVAAVCLSVVGLAMADDARAAIRKPTDIPAEGLVPALKQLAHERNLQVVFQTEIVGTAQTHGAAGELTTQEALKQLLEGTNLVYRFLDDKTITILPASTPEGSGAVQPPSAPPPTSSSQKETANSGAFLLAQAASGQTSKSASVEPQRSRTSASEAPLQEVVVTAQKREERLLDVPVPVTAVNTEQLVSQNELRLRDYYTEIPGLSLTPTTQSSTYLALRGITTGSGGPTVGVMVDDVPFGSSWLQGGGLVVPDIDPNDLERIEVLRGPQGTLYGASSMGGLIKFVTIDPSTAEVSGRLEGGLSGVSNGAQAGYNLRGSVNVPLSDTWALRASGFTRQEPGYIDNPVLHIDGVNEQHVSGGRISTIWRPSDTFSLKLGALYQDYKADGSNDVDVPMAAYPQTAGLGDLQQNYLPNAGGYDRKVQDYSATINARFGTVDVTAVSGYNISTTNDSFDFTYALGPIESFFFPGTSGLGVLLYTNNKNDKFTQEIRVSTPLGSSVDWLVGAFYTHEIAEISQTVPLVDPVTLAQVNSFGGDDQPTKYTEDAAFTDLTFHVTDRFSLQLGGRESHIKQVYSTADVGPLFGAGTFVNDFETTANAFTYLVTPKLQVSPDFMVYARLASGYRAGGPNVTLSPGVPLQYGPDKTQNYELGAKGDFLDHKLSVDASIYYIDWKDIQIALDNIVNYTVNAGRAKSQGLELSSQFKSNAGLTIAGWVTWDDATLKDDFPAGTTAYGSSGDRLPFSSRFSGNLSINEEVALGAGFTGFAGATVSYVGDRLGYFASIFSGSPQRQVYPSYTKADLRAGVERSMWTATVYVTNLADKRGVLTGGIGASPPFAFDYIQPRTFGLNVAKQF